MPNTARQHIHEPLDRRERAEVMAVHHRKLMHAAAFRRRAEEARRTSEARA